MPIAVSEEHEHLRLTVRRWAEAHCPPRVARAAVEAAAAGLLAELPPELPMELPPVWKELADQGWLGLHIPEAHGGHGFGLAETAVVLEELGHALMPGPVLSTVVVSAVLASVAAQVPDTLEVSLLAGLADGSLPAAVHLGPGGLQRVPVADPAPDDTTGSQDGGLVVSGTLRPVLGAPTARLVLAPVEGAGWCLLDLDPAGGGPDPVPGTLGVEALPALDPTRPLGTVTADHLAVPPGRRLSGLSGNLVRDVALAMAAAEAAGGARWCLHSTSEYAKVRVQFGRPIGQFQAVKHRLADMLVTVEQAAAVAWDAAQAVPAQPDERSLSTSVAGSVALEGFVTCAKDCVQLHGGIGFTWEHDAHLYLKRALATRALLGDGDTHDMRVAELAAGGVRRSMAADLGPEAEPVRARIGPVARAAADLEGAERLEYLVANGLIVPHWPAPWGRDAQPLEQLVLDEELAAAGVSRPHLGIGAWALPTIITHGTPEQQERWVRPTMMGTLRWCQLFSEPGAGSDLAALSTRAERSDGGWTLTGQKVWTSLAQSADFGICLARTDPSVPKHEGITFFVLDMSSDGIDIRPLRELTGEAMFNEVFLTAVFVPDGCVIGQPGSGWGIARTTLANERVSMSSGSAFGIGVEQVLRRLVRLGDDATPAERLRVGHLVAEAQSLSLMQHRSTLLSLSGLDLGPHASVRKLLGAEHEQRVQEMGFELTAGAGAVLEGGAANWARGFLATRCLTIAGGTSEVQRNVIAERLLGQPRDPEPGT